MPIAAERILLFLALRISSGLSAKEISEEYNSVILLIEVNFFSANFLASANPSGVKLPWGTYTIKKAESRPPSFILAISTCISVKLPGS